MKKILTIILSMFLVLSTLTFNVFAEGEEPTENVGNNVEEVQPVEEQVEEEKKEIVEKVIEPLRADAVEFSAWTSTTSLPDKGNYYLTDNVTLTGFQYIRGNLTLDLRGKNITVTCENIDNGNMCRPNANDTSYVITFEDTTATHDEDGFLTSSGIISGGNNKNGVGGLIYITPGNVSLTLKDITLSNSKENNATNGYGGGVIQFRSSNSLTVSNCIFDGNSAVEGGAITIRDEADSASINIDHTIFRNNKALTSTNGCGGGALLIRAGNVNISDCKFINNTSAFGGACIHAEVGNKYAPVINVSNSLFDSNTSENRGCVYYPNSAVNATFTNCTITNNSAAGEGGAFGYLNGGSITTLDDCDINNNTCTGNHASVATVNTNGTKLIVKDSDIYNNTCSSDNSTHAAITSINAKVQISGNTVIKNNKNANVERNILLRDNNATTTRLVVDELGDNAFVTVNTYSSIADISDPDKFIEYTENTNEIKVNDNKIRFDNYYVSGTAEQKLKSSYIIYNTTDRFAYAPKHMHKACPFGDSQGDDIYFEEWNSATSLPTSGNYYLTTDVNVTSRHTMNDLVLCLNGHSINGTGETGLGSELMVISLNKTTTITNCRATFDDDGYLTSNAGIHNAYSTATLGGAIYVQQEGNLNLYGVEISDNKNINTRGDSWMGGAILAKGHIVANYSKFKNNYSEGGLVSGKNYDAGFGGAVVLRQNGSNTPASLTTNHTVFESNKTIYSGSAIYAQDDSILNLNNTLFKENRVLGSNGSGDGGAISVTGTTNTQLNNCVLDGNINDSLHGSAMTVQNSASVLLNDTIVKNNKNSVTNIQRAAIVSINNSNITVKGNTIFENNQNSNASNLKDILLRDQSNNNSAKLIVDNLGTNARVSFYSTNSSGTNTVTDLSMVLISNANTNIPNGTLVYANRVGTDYENASKVGYENSSFKFILDSVHTHNVDGDEIEYIPWTRNNSLPKSNGYFYLTCDVVLSSQQGISASEMHLCLNGHTISVDDSYTSNVAISVTRKVNDIYSQSDIYFENCQATFDDDGYLTSTAGIKNGNSSNTTGGVLYVAPKANVHISGIEFSGNKISNTNASQWQGGAILSKGHLYMDHSNFLNNEAHASNSKGAGGAIVLKKDGNYDNPTIDIDMCRFEGNIAEERGGVICNDQDSTVNISNSIFKDNSLTSSSSSGGAAIYAAGNAVFNIDNSVFTENSNAGNHGSTIMLQGNSKVLVNDCLITNNTSAIAGNMRGALESMDNSGITITGNTIVKGNKNNGQEYNVMIRKINADSAKLNIGKLGPDAYFTIHTAVGSANVLHDDPNIFLSAADGIEDIIACDEQIIYTNRALSTNVELSSNSFITYNKTNNVFEFSAHSHKECLGETIDGDVEHTWVAWTNNDSLPNKSGYYYLTCDVELAAQYALGHGYDTHICLNGYNIVQKADTIIEGGSIIRVGWSNNEAQLTITNCKAEFDTDGKLTSTAGIKNASNTEKKGGAVHIDNGNFNAYGIEFSNNINELIDLDAAYNEWGAGAIYCHPSSSTWDDGEHANMNIRNCNFFDNKVLAKEDNVEVYGCGGAINIKGNKNTINISNCVFTGNKATDKGSAINVSRGVQATVNISDCDIYANEITGPNPYGGAVDNTYRSKLIISGDTNIKNNIGGKGDLHLVGTLDSFNLDNLPFVTINSLDDNSLIKVCADIKDVLISVDENYLESENIVFTNSQYYTYEYNTNDNTILCKKNLIQKSENVKYALVMNDDGTYRISFEIPVYDNVSINPEWTRLIVNDVETKFSSDQHPDVVENKLVYHLDSPQIAPKQMNEPLEVFVETYSYSEGGESISVIDEDITGINLQELLKGYIDDPNQTQETKDLSVATLNYGSFTQLYLGYNTEGDLPNSILTPEQRAAVEAVTIEGKEEDEEVKTGETLGVSIYGTSLNLKSETEFNVYFNFDDVDFNEKIVDDLVNAGYKAYIDNNEVQFLQNNANKRFYVKVKGVAAPDLDNKHTITIKKNDEGTLSFEGSVLSYSYKVIDKYNENASKTNLVNCMKAMYLYCDAAKKAIVKK